MKTIIDTSLKTPEEIAIDITQLMDEIELMLSESTSQHAEEKVALLRFREADLPSRLTEFCAAAKGCAAAGARRTDEFVRANPYQAGFIALGVGVALGALLSRRAR